MIGRTQVVVDWVRRAAATQAAVLVTGEKGTGKEVVARAIHRQSQAKDEPFVAVNIAALPENMVESMLLQACTDFVEPKQTIEGPFSPNMSDHSLRRRTPRAPATVSLRSMSWILQRTCDRP